MSKAKDKQRKADNRRMIEQCRERKAAINDHVGLTPQEAKDLFEYIQKHHSWENMYELHSAADVETLGYPRLVKYVRMSMDTRTGDIWCVELDKAIYRTENGYNLKDRLYEALTMRHKTAEID